MRMFDEEIFLGILRFFDLSILKVLILSFFENKFIKDVIYSYMGYFYNMIYF